MENHVAYQMASTAIILKQKVILDVFPAVHKISTDSESCGTFVLTKFRDPVVSMKDVKSGTSKYGLQADHGTLCPVVYI